MDVVTSAELGDALRTQSASCEYLTVLNTGTYGEFGEDGGPGLRAAVREFLRESTDWFVKSSTPGADGYMVLCNAPDQRPALPGAWRQLVNFTRAVIKDVAGGMKRVPLEVAGERLDVCALCEHRAGDRCSLCGCYLDVRPDGGAGKVHFDVESERCPEGRW